MRIGILKCGQSPDVTRAEHGDYDDMFERLLAGRGFTFDGYHVEAMEFPESVHAADGWLITGSRHGVYEDHAFIPPLEDFIRAAFAADVPMVGVCFGHQIIAQAMGGRVVKHPEGGRVGAQDYVIGGKPMVLNAWHQDQVVDLPPGATRLATAPGGEVQAARHAPSVWGVQWHPEADVDVVAGWPGTVRAHDEVRAAGEELVGAWRPLAAAFTALVGRRAAGGARA